MENSEREAFEAINGRFLEAQKAARERDRILSLMASLDESLVKEQEALANLTTQLDKARARVEQLEGMTWTAVWQKIIGSHESELTQEVETYAALKMAHDASEIKINTIQNSLHEFEAALVDLADCDEALTAVQAEQQAFLLANGRLLGEKIHSLNQQISEGQTFLREAVEALTVGEKALLAVTDLCQRLAAAKKGTLLKPQSSSGPIQMIRMKPSHVYFVGAPQAMYFGMGAIVTAAGEIQPMLDLFQLELYDIEYQMTPPPDLQLPAYGEVMLQMRSLHQHNEDARSRHIEKWRAHLHALEKRLRQKVKFLRNKVGYGETAVTQAQTELQTLIERHWQQGESINE